MNTPTKEVVTAAFDEMNWHGRQLWDSPKETKYVRYHQYMDTVENYENLRDAVRDQWAADHGLRYEPKLWTSSHPVLDHVEVFLDARTAPKRGHTKGYSFEPGRVQAGSCLITHSYALPEAIEQYAREHNLLVEFLDWSWYAPGFCTAAVLRAVS